LLRFLSTVRATPSVYAALVVRRDLLSAGRRHPGGSSPRRRLWARKTDSERRRRDGFSGLRQPPASWQRGEAAAQSAPM